MRLVDTSIVLVLAFIVFASAQNLGIAFAAFLHLRMPLF